MPDLDKSVDAGEINRLEDRLDDLGFFRLVGGDPNDVVFDVVDTRAVREAIGDFIQDGDVRVGRRFLVSTLRIYNLAAEDVVEHIVRGRGNHDGVRLRDGTPLALGSRLTLRELGLRRWRW